MSESIIAQQWNWPPTDFRKKIEEIRLRVTAKYASEYAKASFWGKLIVNMKMAYEIKRETQKLDPGYRL